MNCPNCGRQGQRVGLGQTYECPGCGAVFTSPGHEPAGCCGGDAVTDSELADVSRLAQIRQRAAQERLEKVAASAASETPSGRRRSRWAALVFVSMVAGMASVTYLGGALAPRMASAGTDSDLRSLAEAGETGAQFGLALLYDYGFAGSVRDADAAYRWYLKAAAAGDIDAQYYLGQWYRVRSPRPEPAEAVYWITAAADQGQPVAQAVLGDLYLVGEGLDRDPQLAETWYGRAAEQGNAAAHCGLARLYSGQDTGLRRDPPAAAMHDQVARALGKDCAITDYGASAALAKWTVEEGAKRARERVAKGFLRRPVR